MDDPITQLGLLLTQTRFARRALEDIERTTSRYGSFAMTAAAPSGATFGSPPLQDGALRVYIVNLQDLSPGSGFGDTIAGLLGGIGSFVGNLFGGAVGGAVGSITLVQSLGTINTLAERIERIIDKLGLAKTAPQQTTATAEAAAKGTASTAATPPAAGGEMQFLDLLTSLRQKFDAVTALLRVANGPAATGAASAAGGGVAESAVTAPDAERWRAWLDSVTGALDAATRLVGGLIVAVPTAIAAVSWLFDRLPEFRNAIIDTLRFIVRNVLVLTQAIIVLALETIAMVARVAAMAVRTLAKTVDEALAALFTALAKLLDGALELGAVLAGAITKTVNQLLDWLVPRVDEILRHLGELRVFRLISRLVDVLPSLLLLAGYKVPPPADAAKTPAVPTQPPPAVPPPPDLAAIMQQVSKDAKAATDKVTTAAKQLVDEPTNALHKGLTDFGKKLDEAAIKEAELSDTNLAKRLETLGNRATDKANALLPMEPSASSQNVWDRLRGQTAFHPIAAAYGQWLATGGLTQLLNSMTSYFTAPESRSDAAATSRSTPTGPVVQIDEVVIDIAPANSPMSQQEPAGSVTGEGGSLLSRFEYDRERIEREERFDERRGSRGQRRPHVPIWDFSTR